jgi:hypothetical protein
MPSRKAQRRDKPTIIVGHGMIATPTGQFDEARPMAQMPDKIPGKHRWIAIACYIMSDDQVSKAMDPKELKFLDHESMYELSVGCWDCEKQLGSQIAWDSKCTAKGD